MDKNKMYKNNRNNSAGWDEKGLQKIDLAGARPQTLNKEAEKLARTLAEKKRDKLKTHQIRNFYSGILQIRNDVDASGLNLQESNEDWDEKEEQDWFRRLEPRLYRVKIDLAFNTGRQAEVLSLKKFYDILVTKLENTGWRQRRIALYNFLILCESVVAYHKFYNA